jgi:fucose 4-O-acetylase-like acetyltransferase
MMSKSGNRIEGITKLQSVCIFLVVLIHSVPISEMESNPFWVVRGHHFIFIFIMPLFMFLAGYLFILTNLERDISYPRFMFKKAKRLLIPYFVIGSVAFVIKSMFSRYAVRPIAFDLTHYVRGILYPLENPIILFWFLPTLFLIFLLAPVFKRLLIMNNKFLIVAILLLLELLFILNPVRIRFLNLMGVAEYLIYFYAGCLFCFYFRDRVKYLGKAAVVLLLFVLLLAGNEILMRNQNLVLRLHLAFLGIIFSFALAYSLVGLKWNVTRYIDGYYYQIYLLSWFPQGFGRTIYKLGIIDYYFTMVLMLAAGLLIPVLCTKLVVKKMAPIRVLIGIK